MYLRPGLFDYPGILPLEDAFELEQQLGDLLAKLAGEAFVAACGSGQELLVPQIVPRMKFEPGQLFASAIQIIDLVRFVDDDELA